jgi:hypothetical protein
MKLQNTLLLALSTVAIAVTATPTFSQPSSNTDFSFRCDNNSNSLTTVVYNPKNSQKTLPLIHWKGEYIEENISESCKNAAELLQKRYNPQKDILSALQRNSDNKVVFCLITKPNDSCDFKRSDKLFHIKANIPDKKLQEVLPQIIDLNLAEVNPKDVTRGLATIYPRIERKKWLGLFRI